MPQAGLETRSIVAYEQPVPRADIRGIRNLDSAVRDRAVAYRAENGLCRARSCAGGCRHDFCEWPDPGIGPVNALIQVSRVAKARNLPDDQVRSLVNQYTEGRTFGILGSRA